MSTREGLIVPETRPVDGVRYEDVDAAHFERRGLRRYARVLHLRALGVGAVISGEFYGWNFGLGLIAAVSFATLFLVETYRPVIVGVAVWYVLGLLFCALVARPRLVAQAPEEEFALLREPARAPGPPSG
jgi:hypothetical protein